jgi:hypothetical protein
VLPGQRDVYHNLYAARVKELFRADADLAAAYNHVLANGKWDHMMDQTHIGYTSWQEPPVNVMPQVKEGAADKGEDLVHRTNSSL